MNVCFLYDVAYCSFVLSVGDNMGTGTVDLCHTLVLNGVTYLFCNDTLFYIVDKDILLDNVLDWNVAIVDCVLLYYEFVTGLHTGPISVRSLSFHFLVEC